MTEHTSTEATQSAAAQAEAEDCLLPASRKVHARGTLHTDVRVPMRAIALTPARWRDGSTIAQNALLRMYDTGGPYTDRNVITNTRKDLPRPSGAVNPRRPELRVYTPDAVRLREKAKEFRKTGGDIYVAAEVRKESDK